MRRQRIPAKKDITIPPKFCTAAIEDALVFESVSAEINGFRNKEKEFTTNPML